MRSLARSMRPLPTAPRYIVRRPAGSVIMTSSGRLALRQPLGAVRRDAPVAGLGRPDRRLAGAERRHDGGRRVRCCRRGGAPVRGVARRRVLGVGAALRPLLGDRRRHDGLDDPDRRLVPQVRAAVVVEGHVLEDGDGVDPRVGDHTLTAPRTHQPRQRVDLGREPVGDARTTRLALALVEPVDHEAREPA